jgi:hypothetical protein
MANHPTQRSALHVFLMALLAALLLAPASADALIRVPVDPEEVIEEEAPPPKAETPDPDRSILVLGVGWSSGYQETSSPVPTSGPAFYANRINGHVNDWFRQSVAGVFQNWKASAGGAYRINPPAFGSLLLPSSCDHNVFFREVADRAEAAARADGFNPDLYKLVVVQWDNHFCDMGGIQVGRRIGLSDDRVAPMHELGHYLGLEHATSIACTDSRGASVPLSEKCASTEYGDPYDLMGQGTGAYNAVYANQLGWLNNQFIDVAAGDYSASWTLRPFTGPVRERRALRLRDGKTTLWLEYRQEVGIDAPFYNGRTFPATPGLVVHREIVSAKTGKPISQVLDMTPGQDLNNTVLPVGQTWANPLGEMKIRVDSATPEGVTVTISSQRISVPDVRGLTPAKAEAALLGAGLKPTGWGSIVDPTCTNIGVVAATSPTSGARVLPGTSVTVAIGTKDPTRACQ